MTETVLDPREQRQRERFVNKASQTTLQTLRRVEALSGGPESLAPFLEILERIYARREDPVALYGRPTVGTYCVMAPQELILAAGATPVKLCSGSYTAFSVGDDLTPRDACPLIKAVLGFQHSGAMPLYDRCSLMAVPVTCDCKKKLAGALAQTRRVHALQVPAAKGDEEIDQYVRELYEFIGALERILGTRVTYDSLAAALADTAAVQYELSRFLALRKANPYLIRGTHAMAMLNATSVMPATLWARAAHALNRELEQRARAHAGVTQRQLPRILLTGSPIVFPNFKLPLLIEEMGGYLAADETCMGERGLSDPVVPVDRSFDGLMRALAIRALRPCPCPTFPDNTQRLYRLRQMILDHRIDGVIYHVLRGCLVYDYEYRRVEEELGQMGIPVIRVETDYNEEDVEQLRIRVEAFLELIKLKKPPEKRREREETL